MFIDRASGHQNGIIIFAEVAKYVTRLRNLIEL